MKLLHHAVIATVTILLLYTNLHAFTVKGLITMPSKHSVDTTLDRYEAALKKRGLMFFCAPRSCRRGQIRWSEDAA